MPDTSLMKNNMAVFILETDYLSETGYSLHNSRQTKPNLKMERYQFWMDNPPDFIHLFFRQF